MNGLGLAGALFVGGLAGWIASIVTHHRRGLIINLAAGVIGSFLGAFAADYFAVRILPGFASSLLMSLGGAVLLIAVLNLFRRRT